MIDGADLNHIAVAAERRAELAERYVRDLGGRQGPEGPSPGFFWSQVRYSNGMVLEMLEPRNPDENDFLRRFLDRNGPGPHHLTFTVPDFSVALDAAREAGYEPVGVNDSDPHWKEAFLHPRDAAGIVVQLAQSHEDGGGDDGPGGAGSDTSLVYVCHAVRHLHEGIHLFEELLGGRRLDEGVTDDHRFLDYAWPGPGRIRLIAPTVAGPVDTWLGSRPGRVHHVAFEMQDPAGAQAATPRGDIWHVEPTANLGTRLILLGRRG
ncbi:MAG TPA: VOC family protein [Acidimicrobiales bacterium]|nr:VOC family protein [Acidimicrobiales bacterium]